MRLRCLCRSVLIAAFGSSLAMSQLSVKPVLQSTEPLLSASKKPRLGELQEQSSKKSATLAIVYSLILPGLGDAYAGNFQTGRYFLGADVGLWITYGGFRVYGNWLKQDARSFAVQRAGANFDEKEDKFEVDLGNFNSVADYNDAKLRNRQFDMLYDPKSSFSWQWNSETDRVHYKDLRIRGDEVLRNSQFVLGALVLNRVIAAISAARSVSAYNRNVQMLDTWRLNAKVSGGLLAAHGIELTVTKEF